MAQKVLLIHGWGGSDAPHWQAWLAGEIARNYGCVYFLKFSNVEYPDLQTWSNELLDTLDNFQPDIVICHSLANTLWLHLCNEKKLKTVKELFLVAPPSMHCNIEELQSFFPLLTPKTLYAQNALLISSDNDPYMTLQEAKELQEALKIKMEIIPNGGHINAESGFGAWDWILKQLNSKKV